MGDNLERTVLPEQQTAFFLSAIQQMKLYLQPHALRQPVWIQPFMVCENLRQILLPHRPRCGFNIFVGHNGDQILIQPDERAVRLLQTDAVNKIAEILVQAAVQGDVSFCCFIACR